MNRRLIAWVLTACAACGPLVLLAQSVPPSQPNSLRLRRDVNDDNKRIQLNADQIAVWAEENNRVLLLRGGVLVQQDGVRARFQEAVAWIETRPGGGYRVTVYGEGKVRLENGPEVSEGASALVELNTRGQVGFKPASGKLTEASQANDPLVRRALAARADPAPAATVRQTRYEDKPDPLLEPRTPGKTTQILGPAVPPIVPPLPGTPPAAPPIEAGPNTPPPLPPPSAPAPAPRLPPVIEAPSRRFSVSPRSSMLPDLRRLPKTPDGRDTFVITGGAIVTVRDAPNVGLVDIEADRVVIWTKGVNIDEQALLRTPEGQPGQEVEFYLAGNVELRQQGPKDSRTLRADEVYYDVNRNVAIAMNAQIEFKAPAGYQIPDPIVFRAGELVQHAANQYEVFRGEVSSSKLPSDPGLKVYVTQGTIENRLVPRFSTFGLPVLNRQTGQQEEVRELYFRGRDVFFELESVPFFYSPYLAGDLLNPLGPVQDLTFGYNKIFGFQFGATLNVYDLLGIQPFEGTRWRLHFDGLTSRGPAVGSTFDFGGKDLLGIKNTYDGTFSAYVIYDDNFDRLGGGRTSDIGVPNWRGRVLWREGTYDLPYGFSVQSQLSYLSDRTFLEQYFWREFATDINQETFVYVKQQQDFWAWTGLVDPRLGRQWVTQGESLPEFQGRIIGYDLFDIFTYNTRATIGYNQLRVTSDSGSPPASPQDRYARTGRLDWLQEMSLPFVLGPFKIVPYATLDLASYTQDLDNEMVGRVWGGGGVRASIPFSRLYPDVDSELFNLTGLYHKVVFSTNFFTAQTDVKHTQLPQIDRLNDDATDQAIRDIHPMENIFYPGGTGILLSGYPLYDPQIYAIRRLIFNRIDTLNDIEVLQLDLRQRLQTKRGYPGNEHIVDWMTLEVSGSYFPHSSRDNFNSPWAFVEYDYAWNVGDRFTLTSTGWFDPMANGAREWTVGAFLNRPDRTNFFLGYRQINLVNSRALTAAVTYIFSAKYAMTASSTYDFGTRQAQSSSLVFTRMGSDIQVSLGVSYNALQSSFGVLFEIVPNLVPLNRRPGAIGALGQGGLLGH
jgi:hypothetical protein